MMYLTTYTKSGCYVSKSSEYVPVHCTKRSHVRNCNAFPKSPCEMPTHTGSRAASVLPLAVGATSKTLSPLIIGGIARAWGSVGVPSPKCGRISRIGLARVSNVDSDTVRDWGVIVQDPGAFYDLGGIMITLCYWS
jgi:hypothetical protein